MDVGVLPYSATFRVAVQTLQQALNLQICRGLEAMSTICHDVLVQEGRFVCTSTTSLCCVNLGAPC